MHTVPIYESNCLPPAVQRLDLARSVITDEVGLDEEKRESMFKGVMDLVELLLGAEQHAISREEPIIGKYAKVKGESTPRHEIAIEAVGENGEAVVFADCFVVHLMKAI